jgi:hypothetical protein
LIFQRRERKTHNKHREEEAQINVPGQAEVVVAKVLVEQEPQTGLVPRARTQAPLLV